MSWWDRYFLLRRGGGGGGGGRLQHVGRSSSHSSYETATAKKHNVSGDDNEQFRPSGIDDGRNISQPRHHVGETRAFLRRRRQYDGIFGSKGPRGGGEHSRKSGEVKKLHSQYYDLADDLSEMGYKYDDEYSRHTTTTTTSHDSSSSSSSSSIPYPSKTRHVRPNYHHNAGGGGGGNALLGGVLSSVFSSSSFPLSLRWILKLSLTSLAALYVLNQTHILPKWSPTLSHWTSKVLFYPTLPITIARRISSSSSSGRDGRFGSTMSMSSNIDWVTPIDDTVVIGGAPISWLGYSPQTLQEEYGVGAVVNFCKEYVGPTNTYEQLGMEYKHFPTIDHLEPSTQDLYNALIYLQDCQRRGVRVYVHCRAGHGRSGACVLSWIMLQDMIDKQQQEGDYDDSDSYDDEMFQQQYENDVDVMEEENVTLQRLNRELGTLRKVRSSLWKQPNIRKVRDMIKQSNKDYRNLRPWTKKGTTK